MAGREPQRGNDIGNACASGDQSRMLLMLPFQTRRAAS
jgi:hypothetical protein